MGERKRIYILDALRGIAVVAMIVHHSYVLLNFSKGVYCPFFDSDLFSVLQLFFVSIFLLVSGICTNFSRNILKRGIVVFAAAMLVTLATAVILPLAGFTGLEIYFGILHMFGLSMLLYALIKPLLDKCNPYIVMAVMVVLFVFQLIIMDKVPFLESPMNVMMLFGFPSKSFYSADYYPLFPYFFMFVIGAMLGRPIAERRFPNWFYTMRLKSFEIVGRHSLIVYLAHQPIVFVVIELIYLFIR